MIARPTTINGLVDQLCERLEEILEQIRLESAGSTSGAMDTVPQVVPYDLPPPRGPSAKRPPVIIVRPLRGKDEDDGSRISVRLLLETCTEQVENAAGMRDQANLIQRIKDSLAASRIVGPFMLELPIEWQLFEDQPQPIWAAQLTTTWLQRQAEEIVPLT